MRKLSVGLMVLGTMLLFTSGAHAQDVRFPATNCVAEDPDLFDVSPIFYNDGALIFREAADIVCPIPLERNTTSLKKIDVFMHIPVEGFGVITLTVHSADGRLSVSSTALAPPQGPLFHEILIPPPMAFQPDWTASLVISSDARSELISYGVRD